MQARWITVVAVLAGLSALPVRAQDERAGAHVEVPVREVILSNGTRRYAVLMTAGGTAIEAGLDTGSVGLRLLERAAGGMQIEATPRGTTYSYGIGTRFRGVAAETTLAFDALSGPVPLQIIQKIDCRPDKPACPAAHADPANFGIQGDGLPGAGFVAIFGINMGEDEIANPLVKLGVKRWLIELPKPGDTAPGKLILNPTAAETTGFIMFPIIRGLGDSDTGAHDAIDGCLRDLKTQKTICGALMLDTGAPGIRVVSADREKPWAEGDPAQLILLKDGKPALWDAFTVGRREQASHFATEDDPQKRVPHLYTGLMPYFLFDVLYDPQHGEIGLRSRSESVIPPPAP